MIDALKYQPPYQDILLDLWSELLMSIYKVKIAIQTLIKNDDGAALVEFALIFPVITFIFMGMIEFGFIMKEWRRVNDLVEAQVLYLSASNISNGIPSNAEQFYSSTTSSNNTIYSAVAEINSRILAADTTPNVTFGCGCPEGTGSSAKITLKPFNIIPPYCSPPPDKSCGAGSYYYAYVDVKATKQHVGFFLNIPDILIPNIQGKSWSWRPLLSAHALVRIY